MPAATLELQDVKTIYARYDSQGKPRPGLLKTLDEIGLLRGTGGKVGSVPRLKKLIDQINLEEINQRFDMKKSLPDPISTLATQLYNQLYEDAELYEGRIRSEYTEDIANLNHTIESLKSQHSEKTNQTHALNLVIDDYDTAVLKAQQQLASDQISLNENQQAITQLSALLAAARETTKATQASLVMRESQYATEISRWHAKTQDLETALEQKEQQLRALNKEKQMAIDVLNNDILGRQSFINSLKEDNITLKNQLTQQKKEGTVTNRDLTRTQTELACRKGDNIALQIQIDQLKASLALRLTENSQLLDRFDQIDDQLKRIQPKETKSRSKTRSKTKN